ncbi:MAG: hypothetical protein KQJ78_00270 [Deltaproteobacteria bacterium]|nr:hypothetical protein [Deltaproteobacteria bacterium]
MLIQQIPLHVRHTVEYLDLPLYCELTPEECRPPARLALGDTLMVLGLLRNLGRPLALCLDPGPQRELVEAHPLVRELRPPTDEPPAWAVRAVAQPSSGRAITWVSDSVHRLKVPVCPVDQVRANPVLAHSLHYGLDNLDDRPSVFVDPARPPQLAGLLSSRRPTLVLFPFNPGRADHYWQDEAWWRALARGLKDAYALVAVGAAAYGELAAEVDATLSLEDPASTLPDLAWLLSRAAGFAGRDGGLSHLALAVCPRSLVVWDSMAAYRFWAGRTAGHLIFSNPYTFRYPQTMRLTRGDLLENVPEVTLPGPDGAPRQVPLPQQGYFKKVEELFGSVAAFQAFVLRDMESRQERNAVEAWFNVPRSREMVYRQSLDFARRFLGGGVPRGLGWVAPAAN